jgi:hypothetical protein
MQKTYTQRGFGRYEFVEDNGAECSLQLSSSGTRIWLGCNNIGLKVGYPWREVSEEEIKIAFNGKELVSNSRMHLSVDQVKALIPILQRFVQTGDI